jgi:hypothetical protein
MKTKMTYNLLETGNVGRSTETVKVADSLIFDSGGMC